MMSDRNSANFVPRAESDTYIVRGTMHQAMLCDDADLNAYLEFEACTLSAWRRSGDAGLCYADVLRSDGSISAQVYAIMMLDA